MNEAHTTFSDTAWRYLEGIADAESDRAFAAMLDADATLVDAFAELCLNRRCLAEVIASKGSVAAFLNEPQEPAPALAFVELASPARWTAGRWALAACVLLAGLAVATLALVSGGSDQPIEPAAAGRPVAVLLHSQGVRWEREPINEGDDVAAGDFAISAGRVRLQLHSGVAVSLQGPARLDLTDAMHARLSVGRILARVPRGAEGFTVQTPDLRIIDMGTEFGVHVDDAGVTGVHVFDGRVRVERGADHRELTAGQSATLTDDRLAIGSADADAFPGATAPGGRLLDLAFTPADVDALRPVNTASPIADGPIDGADATGRGGHLALEGGDHAAAVFVDLDTRPDGPFARAGLLDDHGRIGRDGSHVYLAWRTRGRFISGGWAGLGLFRGGDEDLRDETLFIGKAHGLAAVSYYAAAQGETLIDGRPATPAVDPIAPDDRAVRMVVRIDFAAGNDRVQVWIDADPGDEAPLAPNATLELTDAAFDRLRLAAGPGAGVWAFDELRMSRNWADLADDPASDLKSGGAEEND